MSAQLEAFENTKVEVGAYWDQIAVTSTSYKILILDGLVTVFILVAAVFQVTKIKAKLNLQAVFTATAIVGACCLTLRYQTLNEFLVDARTVAMFILPIPIGLACLSVLNLLGWVYGRVRR